MNYELNPAYIDNRLLHDFMRTLPQRFEEGGTMIFSGSRNVIKSFSVDPDCAVLRNVVVKRFRPRNIFQLLAYSTFWQSKAKRAYHNGRHLTRLCEHSTPYPIAYAEERHNGLMGRCYYLTPCTEAQSVAPLLNVADYNRALAKAFARFIAMLHEGGIVHHDLNFSNVLYTEDKGQYDISVIDINRMTVSNHLTLADCKDDFVRWTDDMQLFEHVMREYARARKLDEETFLSQALAMKQQHDKAWKRRKDFTHKIKKLFIF